MLMDFDREYINFDITILDDQFKSILYDKKNDNNYVSEAQLSRPLKVNKQEQTFNISI